MNLSTTGCVSIPIRVETAGDFECYKGDANESRINFSMPFLENCKLSNYTVITIGETLSSDTLVTEHPFPVGSTKGGAENLILHIYPLIYFSVNKDGFEGFLKSNSIIYTERV